MPGTAFPTERKPFRREIFFQKKVQECRRTVCTSSDCNALMEEKIRRLELNDYLECLSSQALRTAPIISSTMAARSAAFATPEEEPVASAPAMMVL